MNNSGFALSGGFLGFIAGEATYHAGLEVGFRALVPTVGWGIQLLSFSPFVLGLIPTIKIAQQINAKYENSPLKLMTAHFLLFSSYAVLSEIIRLSILAAFVSSLNPFTLPIMIAAGVTASIILGLYFLTKPEAQGPSIFQSIFSFFPKQTKNDPIHSNDKYPVSHAKPILNAHSISDQDQGSNQHNPGEKYPISHANKQVPIVRDTPVESPSNGMSRVD